MLYCFLEKTKKHFTPVFKLSATSIRLSTILMHIFSKSCKMTCFQNKKISNDQELIQSDPISCPQNQKGNNYLKYIN